MFGCFRGQWINWRCNISTIFICVAVCSEVSDLTRDLISLCICVGNPGVSELTGNAISLQYLYVWVLQGSVSSLEMQYLSLWHSFDTKKPGSTAKCMVRHKKARFDTKMPSSTQNALPSMHQWTLPLSNIPRPFCENIFFQFYFNILFLRTHREMKRKLYWYEFKTNKFNIIMKIEM